MIFEIKSSVSINLDFYVFDFFFRKTTKCVFFFFFWIFLFLFWCNLKASIYSMQTIRSFDFRFPFFFFGQKRKIFFFFFRKRAPFFKISDPEERKAKSSRYLLSTECEGSTALKNLLEDDTDEFRLIDSLSKGCVFCFFICLVFVF